jgi:hypothetical protein
MKTLLALPFIIFLLFSCSNHSTTENQATIFSRDSVDKIVAQDSIAALAEDESDSMFGTDEELEADLLPPVGEIEYSFNGYYYNYIFVDSQGNKNGILLESKDDASISLNLSLKVVDGKLCLDKLSLGLSYDDKLTFKLNNGVKVLPELKKEEGYLPYFILSDESIEKLSRIPVEKVMSENVKENSFQVQNMSNPNYFIELFNTLVDYKIKERI